VRDACLGDANTAFTLGTDFNAAPLPANKATLAYAMNLVGNRGSRTKTVAGTDPLGAAVAPTVSTYAYDGQDRATTVGGTSPTWDKKDNALTTGNGKTYQWDRRNRLSASTTGGTTTTLGYDAEGLRVSKQVGAGTPTRYLVDTMNPTGYGQVLVEYTGDGASRQPVRTYTYGLDLISQRTILGGLVEFFSTDVLGTTRFLTQFDPTPGATGGLNGDLGELTTHTFNYDAFGTLVGSTTATPYLYTGEQWDADVGAYYLRARWYLPEWGRFLSRDTYEGEDGDPISQGRFLYANVNPIRYVDPSGYSSSGEQITVTQVQGNIATIRTVGTSRARSKVIKRLYCVLGPQSVRAGARALFNSGRAQQIEFNHAIPTAMAGDPAQAMGALLSDTHRTYHWILHLLLRRDDFFASQGLHNWSSESKWSRALQHKSTRQALLIKLLAAAHITDSMCKLKPPFSIKPYVKQQGKAWVQQAPLP
jgi:RHS repeat-associated protein